MSASSMALLKNMAIRLYRNTPNGHVLMILIPWVENIDSNRQGFRETFFGAQALKWRGKKDAVKLTLSSYMCTAASAGGAALPARHLVSALQFLPWPQHAVGKQWFKMTPKWLVNGMISGWWFGTFLVTFHILGTTIPTIIPPTRYG